jgi:asparagine synthase (glutamine-hydrolysing)
MCGIAGFADLLPRSRTLDADRQRIKTMCDVMRHRGPDDDGFYVEPGIGLGMRRLSIIDLSTGHQPIHNEDGTVWVVFNGEIYNYRELRAALEAAGHRFYTSSDTETIVHGYEQWGEEVFGRLRGMFGIALWDTRSQTLLIGRDRAGIKPLYYAEAAGRLFFGSEAKCVLANPEVDRTLDPAALDHYLAYLYTPRDRAIFRGMRKLPPGHLLRVHGGRVEVSRYWQLPVAQTFTGSEGDALDALDRTLADAVRSHMVSDVPLGAFLSGGIDSSLVVDEPFADSSAIPTWYVSEIARRHVTVVLSGDGGDELFGGYDRYLPHPRVARFDRLDPGIGRAVAAATWRALPRGARGKNFLRHVARDPQGRYLDSMTFFFADEREALLAPDLRPRDGWDSEAYFAAPFARLQGLPLEAQMMAFDFETYLPEDCLTKVDRMSSAHSIESRVPLLDHHVVEFAASLPVSMKIRGDRRKHLLKTLAFRYVPREILDRPKQGFGVPIGHWFRGSLRETFGDILGSPTARQRGYFNYAFVDRVLQEHLSGRRDHSLRLWQLLVFELWHRQYVDATAVAA